MPQTEYRYVGSQDILDSLPKTSGRVNVKTPEDVIRWVDETNQPRERDGIVIATFIIDVANELWVNDRRSEHVLCAAGGNVLSAGEITFEFDRDSVEVPEITNQSTGYCPESSSWWAVEKALTQIGLTHPPDFTMAFIFRLCKDCGTKNIVKDGWFECGVCQKPLSETWDFDRIHPAYK